MAKRLLGGARRRLAIEGVQGSVRVDAEDGRALPGLFAGGPKPLNRIAPCEGQFSG